MSDRATHHPPRRRALLWPALALVCSVAILSMLWWTFRQSEIDRLTTTTTVTAEQISLRLEAWVETRIELVDFLARTCSTRPEMDLDEFRSLARQYLEVAPGFQAINWVDADWVVRVIVPAQGNEPVLGFDLHHHPSAGVVHALAEAESTGRLHRTTRVDLVQGGSGFVTYAPVLGADGAVRGFVNGVFRNDSLVDSCLNEPALRSEFRFTLLEEDGEVVYTHGGSEPFTEWPYAVRTTVSVSDHPWTLILAPSPEMLAGSGQIADEVLLAVAILLAVLFAVAMHTAVRHQTALAENEARYRLLVENQTDMVVKVDLEGRFLFVSPSYCRTFGKSEDELIGRRFMPLVHEDDREQTARAMVELLSPPHSVYVEQRAMTRDGWRWIGWADTAVLDDDGEVVEIIGVGRDITTFKRLEEKLLQSQKMEAIGQLAGGVAHDFNNILQAMRSHVDLADRELAAGNGSERHLAEIRISLERAADLTRQLLAFGRRQVMRPENLDLGSLARDIVGLLERIIGEQVRLVLDIGAEPRIVRADPRQLEQVLVNLCVNARDAMPDGGTVTISVGRRTLDTEFCDTNPWARPGTYATLEVRDTGVGMDEAIQTQIFEPFFTTKPLGKGTGLGLATVFGIVTQHEGFLDVVSAVGEGTRITVYLPLVDGSVPDERRDDVLEAPGGSETVLLAEDDPSVRLVVDQILEEAGYRVVTGQNGSEAMAILDRGDPTVDIAILDVVMPGSGGLDVARFIRDRGLPVAILLTSGYSLELARTVAGENLPLLTKPFRRDELLARVRELLDG